MKQCGIQSIFNSSQNLVFQFCNFNKANCASFEVESWGRNGRGRRFLLAACKGCERGLGLKFLEHWLRQKPCVYQFARCCNVLAVELLKRKSSLIVDFLVDSEDDLTSGAYLGSTAIRWFRCCIFCWSFASLSCVGLKAFSLRAVAILIDIRPSTETEAICGASGGRLCPPFSDRALGAINLSVDFRCLFRCVMVEGSRVFKCVWWCSHWRIQNIKKALKFAYMRLRALNVSVQEEDPEEASLEVGVVVIYALGCSLNLRMLRHWNTWMPSAAGAWSYAFLLPVSWLCLVRIFLEEGTTCFV